jgi:hypothetical protein
MVASVGAVGASLLTGGHGESLALALSAIPGLLLASPIALAKLGWEPGRARAASGAPLEVRSTASPTSTVRVADEDVPPVLARVESGAHAGEARGAAEEALAAAGHAAAHSK